MATTVSASSALSLVEAIDKGANTYHFSQGQHLLLESIENILLLGAWSIGAWGITAQEH